MPELVFALIGLCIVGGGLLFIVSSIMLIRTLVRWHRALNERDAYLVGQQQQYEELPPIIPTIQPVNQQPADRPLPFHWPH